VPARDRSPWRELLGRAQRTLAERPPGRAGAPEEDEPWRALTTRLRPYAALLVRNAGRLVRDDADDLVQRVLLKLQEPAALARVVASENAIAYLLAMLRNEAALLARGREREEDALATVGRAPAAEEAARGSGAELLDERVRRALERLGEEDRRLLALRFWGGLSVREVARILGLGYSATMSRYFRLFHRLRRDLGTEHDPGHDRGHGPGR